MTLILFIVDKILGAENSRSVMSCRRQKPLLASIHSNFGNSEYAAKIPAFKKALRFPSFRNGCDQDTYMN